MIKFESDSNNGKMSIEVHGRMTELMADACVFIHYLYKAISEKDEAAGEHFKDFVSSETFSASCFKVLGSTTSADTDDDIDKLLNKLADKIVAGIKESR